MRQLVLIVSIAGCNSLLGIPGSGELAPKDGPQDGPPGGPSGVTCQNAPQECALFAVDRNLARSPAVIHLEGTFGDTVTVKFPGAPPIAAMTVGAHRATIEVPSTATTGFVSVTTAGREVGNVPFRNTSFRIGVTYFQSEYPQTSGARQAPRLTGATSGAPAVVIGDHVYVIGGRSGGPSPTSFDVIEAAVMNADGTLGKFTLANQLLTTPRAGSTAHVIGDHLYVIGGTSGAQALATTDTAPITAGTLGGFVAGPMLTTPRGDHTSAVIGNHLYVFGGQGGNGEALASVERARINPDGTLASFATVEGVTLATGRIAAATVVVGDKLYVLGGRPTISGAPIDSIERASIKDDGTLQAFEAAGKMPVPRAGHTVLVLGDSVVMMGGRDELNTSNQVYQALVGPDNDLDFQMVQGGLAIPRAGAAAVVANNNLHLIGGISLRSGEATALRAVEHTSLIADGDLDDFVGVPNVTISNPARTGATYAVLGRALHVFGGDDHGTLSGDHRGAPIDAAGNVQQFSMISTETPRSGHAQAIAGNHIHVFGGFIPAILLLGGGGGTTLTVSVESAAIDPNGTVGAFSSSQGNDLVAPGAGMSAVVIGEQLYAFGDFPSTDRTPIQAVALDAGGLLNGDFSSFGTESGTNVVFGDTAGSTQACVAVIQDYVYHIGGTTAEVIDSTVTLVPSGHVERAPVPRGTIAFGHFERFGQGLTARFAVTCAVVGRYLYVLGGDATGIVIERAEIFPGGDLGSFEQMAGKVLAAPRFDHRTAELGDGLYLLGGRDTLGPTNTLARATLR